MLETISASTRILASSQNLTANISLTSRPFLGVAYSYIPSLLLSIRCTLVLHTLDLEYSAKCLRPLSQSPTLCNTHLYCVQTIIVMRLYSLYKLLYKLYKLI